MPKYFLDIRKLQDAGFEQSDNKFLLRISDCLDKSSEIKTTNRLSNNKYSCENLPKGPSILKRGFSEILLLIQRAYTLINTNCTVPGISKLCEIINIYLNKSEYKQTDDIIIILHEKLTLIAEHFIKRGITDISKGITFHDPYINCAINQKKILLKKSIIHLL